MISCIITTYKRDIKVLSRAVNSVLNQTYKDIELIVVNDAPYEKELEKAVGEYVNNIETDINVSYVQCWERKGACAARNVGLAKSRGEYVAYLDDDDEWLPDKLSELLAAIEKEEAVLAYGARNEIQADGSIKTVYEEFANRQYHWNEFEKLLCYNYVGSTSCPLIRKKAMDYVGGFTVGLKASQDHDLWIKLAEIGKLVYISKPVLNYYFSEVSISTNMQNKISGYEYILNKHKKYYFQHLDIYNYRLNYLAYCCLKYGDYLGFVKYYCKALKVKCYSKNNLFILEKIAKRI